MIEASKSMQRFPMTVSTTGDRRTYNVVLHIVRPCILTFNYRQIWEWSRNMYPLIPLFVLSSRKVKAKNI